MVEEETKASPEEISEFRRQFLEKYENDGTQETGGFHPLDLHKVKHNDDWLARFLEYNDLNFKQALKQLSETCEWRQKYGLNDICEENIRMDYIMEGQMFARNKDLDGNLLLIFICKMYVRGSKNMDDLKRCFLYWVERSYRESNGVITCIFDMQGTGLNNVDMDYTRFMINTFKYYYPNSLNYILVYDMPWILNATFQIIKRLLPAKAVARLKFVNSKSIRQYIDDENMLDVWGGQDSSPFEFVPEVREKTEIKNDVSEPNNDVENNQLNGTTHHRHHHRHHHHHHHSNRKVHFANLTPADSPMSELSNSSSFANNDSGDMLYLSPAETIVFQKTTNNEFVGNVDIRNISSKAVTYKIKTTTPDKFRVRPSSGTLLPNETVTINVVLQKGHKIQPMIRDKFLVMAISLPDISTTTPDDIACIWKNVTANSTDVEQHRLKCALPSNITTAIINSVDGEFFTDGEMSDQYGGGPSSSQSIATTNNFNTTRQSNSTAHLQTTISQLNDTVHRLEQHMKFNQTLQWISIFLFFLLSISIVYILKSEIQNSNSQYCIDNK